MDLRIGIVAGESSGDQLAAGLIAALRAREAGAHFEGVAGPAMTEAGCRALYSAEKLSVMGLVEVLGHLPGLLAIRRNLVSHFAADPPAVFIGVDAPDFNLGLEERLRAAGIPTVHYVSPSVWAWRENRIPKIGRAADLVLCLFPFEPPLYETHGVRAVFVGHPMADEIPETTDPLACRRSLGLPSAGPWLALLPGSRRSEVRRLGPVFLATCRWLHARLPGLRFVAPMATPAIRAEFSRLVERHAPGLPITLLDGQARAALGAGDAVLLASGTAALEAMLIKRPMAVAYKLAPVTYAIVKLFRLLRVPRYSLPNILAGRELAPEFMQGRARPELLGPALLRLLQDPAVRDAQLTEFSRLHAMLRRNASGTAAAAVMHLLEEKSR